MATKKDDQQPVPRNTREYQLGLDAYLEANDSCPFAIGNSKRIGWWTGWLDARTYARLPQLFPSPHERKELRR